MDNLSIESFHQYSKAIEAEVAKVIVGQQEVVRLVLVSILAGGHLLLEGVPGLGKTMLIRTLGQVLDLQFSRIQFTPDLMPADIVGTDILVSQEGQRQFKFQQGPVFANLVLADEINRATPKTQSAMLEAMQEHSVTIADKTYQLKEPFFVMATQNPIEMEGTYPLPEAQLDRFFFKINVRFPGENELTHILNRTTGSSLPVVQKVANGAQLVQMHDLARQVPVASHVTEWVSRLIIATHPDSESAIPLVKQFVRFGSSPRGGQALLLGAKINALLAGRYNVSFEDIKAIVPAALRHRLLLNFEGLAEGISPDTVIQELLSQVEPLKS